jgi:hypothetical protein
MPVPVDTLRGTARTPVSDTTGSGHVTVAVGEPPFEALFVPAT